VAGADYTPGRLSAREQANLLRRYPVMIPSLCSLGLTLEDAIAAAYNTTLLFYAIKGDPPFAVPEDILRRYSFGEIAELCELQGQVQRGDVEFGLSGEADA